MADEASDDHIPRRVDGRPSVQKWDEARKILEVLAVVAGAAWTLTTFFAYQHEQEKLRTEQLRLANEQQALSLKQMTLVADTERQTKEVTLAQQGLALKQAKLLASNERERAQVSLEQQKLALKQSTLTSEAEIQKAALSAKILELEAGLKGTELKSAMQGRIQITANLTVFCSEKPGAYRAQFEHSIVNTSKANVEVSWEIVHRYLGKLTKPLDAEAIVAINSVPVGIYGLRYHGAVDWQELGYDAYVFPKNARRQLLDTTGYKFVEGGGSTKILRPGDESHSTKVYFVRGQPDQWIGFALAFGLDNAISGDGTFREQRSDLLADCKKKEDVLDQKPSVSAGSKGVR